jgi:hypothetical protein
VTPKQRKKISKTLTAKERMEVMTPEKDFEFNEQYCNFIGRTAFG